MSIGNVRRVKFITREMIRADKTSTYLFGDNMTRTGYGGQAREMRGEPNVIGIPTKRAPSNDEWAFFSDNSLLDSDIARSIDEAFGKAEDLLLSGHDIVVPADGLGSGLAQLPTRAPLIYHVISSGIERLEALASGVI